MYMHISMYTININVSVIYAIYSNVILFIVFMLLNVNNYKIFLILRGSQIKYKI